jgi:hypothetical protein
LVFRHGEIELLRLSGVVRPNIFRDICLNAQRSLVLVRKVVQEQTALAE